MKSLLRLLVAVLLCLLAVVALVQPVDLRFLSGQLSVWLTQLGLWAPVGFVVLRAAMAAAGLPIWMLAPVAGALFGIFWGSLYALSSAVGGALIAFSLARFLGRDWSRRRWAAGGSFARFDENLARQGFWFVLSMRLNPLMPFSLANYVLGLSSISLRNFALGTLLGGLPGTVVVCWLGASGKEALTGGSGWPLFAASLTFALLALLPVALKHLRTTPPAVRQEAGPQA